MRQIGQSQSLTAELGCKHNHGGLIDNIQMDAATGNTTTTTKGFRFTTFERQRAAGLTVN